MLTCFSLAASAEANRLACGRQVYAAGYVIFFSIDWQHLGCYVCFVNSFCVLDSVLFKMTALRKVFFTGNVTMSFEYLSWPLGWRKVSCQHKHNSKVYCSRVSDRSRTVSVTGQRCQWENTDSWPSLTEVNSLSVVPDWLDLLNGDRNGSKRSKLWTATEACSR